MALSALLVVAAVSAPGHTLSAKHLAQIKSLKTLGAPALADLLERSKTDPMSVIKDIQASPLAEIVEPKAIPTGYPAPPAGHFDNAAPVVVGHGMGDSCFNGGMKQITQQIGQRVGQYSVCIPTGDNWIEDTLNGFLLNLDKSIDVFAEKVRNDSRLSGGFNAFTLSQAGLIMRGYIQKYNDPPVKTWLGGWAIVQGVAGFPQCNPGNVIIGGLCSAITEALGELAYLDVVQDVLFQAAMFRDPLKVNTTQYTQNSMLANLNNRGPKKHPEYNQNLNVTEKYVMIRGLKDTEVWPNEGEWWGLPSENPALWNKNEAVEPMNQTSTYKSDLFGLQTVDKAGKIVFESSPGNHMQFTMDQLYGWVDKYLK